jgi:hypothetical protein
LNYFFFIHDTKIKNPPLRWVYLVINFKVSCELKLTQVVHHFDDH